MNDIELNEVLDLIRVNYRNFFKDETKQQRILALKTWKYHFSNVPQNVMFKIIMDYIGTVESYPPDIAKLKSILLDKISVDNNVAEDSFTKIYELVARCGSDKFGYEKALEQFSEIEKSCITQAYWKELGQSDPNNITTLKAQYRTKYNSVKEKIVNQEKIELNENVLKLMGGNKLLKE